MAFVALEQDSQHRQTWYGMTRSEVITAEVRAAMQHVGAEVERSLGRGLTAPVFIAVAQYASSFGRLAAVRIFAARTWKRRRTIRRIQKQQELLLRALEAAVRDEIARRMFGGTPTGSA